MNKTVKKLFSTVSVVLCASIGLSLPLEVYAASSQPEEQTYSSFDNVQGETEEIGNIVTELTDERTEYAKEFLLDDGTKMIAEYDQPIHYQNDKGEWVDYNNSLASDSKSATPDEAADGELVNKSSNIEVKLSNKAKKNNMVKVTSDDYSISWGYDGANKSKAQIIKDDTKLSGNDEFTTLTNLTSETLYKDVFKNVDLQYFVSSTGVKENIILKSSDVQNEFNVTYKIKNLTAKQTDDYTITLYNKSNKEVYRIVAPYMMDAKGETSTQLKLSLESQKGSNLNVKLTADYWFIHGLGRIFPITIDPEITTGTNSSLNEAYKSGYLMNHGPYYIGSNEYTAVKVNSLRTLEAGNKIISAKYHFNIRNHDTLFSNENDNDIIVNAHKLTGYNTAASYDSNVIDYDSLSFSDNSSLTFDLTKLYNEWYSNGNSVDGFILEAWDTIGSKQVMIDDTSSARPLLTVVYKDYSGTESNLSYHTFDAGYNAKVSISDYLGNLVIDQTLYEGTGSRMPVAITSTFNSFSKEWNYSFNQRIAATSAEMMQHGYDYIYTDSKGTKHYLKKDASENKWFDEDELGIELTVSENYATVKSNYTQTYALPSNGGWLISEKDEHDNTITYTRSNGKLTGIQDGAGRNITVNYSGNNISSFNLPGNKTVNLSYSNGKLITVTFPDNRKSVYNYNNDGDITYIQQDDSISGSNRINSKIGFNYTDGKVTKITEYGSDNSQGNYLEIEYNADNTTIFTDRQERKATYTFDNKGNKISILNANGYIESSESNGFSVSDGADSFTKNYITESTEQSTIKNNGYYFKVNGSKGSINSSGGTASIDTSPATEENGQVQYLGTTSIKVNNPASSSNSAFFTGAAHQFNDTSFNGKDVTFSAYIKTKEVKQIYSGGPIGATLKIKCFDSNNTALLDVNSIGISGTEEWQRLSISATIPENTSYFRVYCNLRYASGTAWFDCLQLEEGICANDFNALQNADFSSNDYWLNNDNNSISVNNGTVTLKGKSGAFNDAESAANSSAEEETQPATYYETVSETTPNDSIVTYDEYGNEIKSEQGFVTRTVKKTYEVDTTTSNSKEVEPVGSGAAETESDNSLGNKYIYQNVNVGRAGVQFNISGEAQAKSVPLSNENRTFGIALNIYYQNNPNPETHYKEFNSYTDHKQSVNLSITPEKTDEVINYVAFAFVYGYNENEMTVYNAMLNIADIGYVLSDDSASTETESEDNYIDYEVISETVDKTKPFIQSSKTYDNTGNYVSTETDELGNTVSYTYDANGNVIELANGSNYYIDYEYDSSGNVTKISSENAENVYSYNGAGNISAIDHNNFRYSFNYDVFNNLVSTKIGNVAIASNTYSANNGNLTKTTYANGDYIEYTYDEYDNIIGITGETGSIAQFIYNKKGLVSKVIDDSSETITYYYYDFNGNVTGEYRQTAAGDLSYFLSYDKDGNQVEKTSVNGQVKTITTGTDDNGNEFVSNDGVTVKNVTDDFGRKTAVKTSRGENTAFYTDYEYANGTETNSTTNYVSKIIQKFGSNELVNYEYAYDSVGNISTIKENGSLVIDYDYDDLNQLSVINDKTNKIYTHYSYDDAGNITSVLKRGYNNYGVPSSKISEDTYTYGDSNWKDKLTAFNGQTITYDEMGNPLNYRDGMSFTWVNGRKLNSVKVGNTTLNMKYDSNGMRTQKGDVHYYYDSNKSLIALTNGNNTLFFYYDSEGNPTSFTHNGTMYYYIKNLQGDILKIVNENGTVIANYAYDVSGEILSIKDNSGNAITDNTSVAILNPYRYRGYIYDDETGLYYLQSRYYDPVTERFLNADDTTYICSTGTIISANLFSYCENNPVNYTDKNGYYAAALTVSSSLLVQLSSALNGIITGITASIASIKTALVTAYIVALCIIAVGVAIAGIVYVVNKVKSISASATKVVSAVKAKLKQKGLNPKNLKNNTVYIITRKGTLDVVYVGRTCRYGTRKNQHKKRFPEKSYTMYPIATNLSLKQARALEQTIITAYGIDTLKNMINSISPKKWGNFKTEFKQMQTLIESFYDPE